MTPRQWQGLALSVLSALPSSINAPHHHHHHLSLFFLSPSHCSVTLGLIINFFFST